MPGHVDGYVDIASVAALLADPTRAAILYALGDGQALPAGRLADRVHVSPSTASNHLSKLVERRLLAVEKQGRHRYYRLAEPEIAGVLEALALVAPPAPIRSLRESDSAPALRAARLCHNHLAGALGVAVTKAMVECSILAEVEDGYVVTDAGKE
jgi:DNA-binding transcriptional ArsR family regulator